MVETCSETGRFTCGGEGGGLCFAGAELVMSGGSDQLIFRDPQTFEVLRSLTVRLNGTPRDSLNELECVGEWVFANVWHSDIILRIDKATGQVTATIDASSLLSATEAAEADVLNGIAFNPSSETFYITGKLWPKLFEVRFGALSGDAGEDGGNTLEDAGVEKMAPLTESGDRKSVV